MPRERAFRVNSQVSFGEVPAAASAIFRATKVEVAITDRRKQAADLLEAQRERKSAIKTTAARYTLKGASFRQSLLLGGLPVRRRRLVVNHCCKWRGPPKPRRSRPPTGFLKPTLCTHLRARTTFDQTIRLGSRDFQNGITAARGSRVVCSFDEPRKSISSASADRS